MATVYIETTIPCYYHEIRTDPDSQVKRAWTRHWWDDLGSEFQRVTSAAVIYELSRGDYPIKEAALSLVSDLPILPAEAAIAEIVEAYVRHRLMPADPFGDALNSRPRRTSGATSSSRGTAATWPTPTSLVIFAG
jgi:hypothetical protein